MQVVTDPVGKILWLSPALPGRTHDLTAARTHKILRICERRGVPVLADMACIGAGDWVTTARRRVPRLKSWQTFRRCRISPSHMSVITKAALTLERQH